MAKPAQIVTGAVLVAASLVLLPVAVGRAFAAARGDDSDDTSGKGANPPPRQEQSQDQPPAQAAGAGGPGTTTGTTTGLNPFDVAMGIAGEIGRAFDIGRGIAGDIRQDNKDKAAKDAAAAA